MPFGMNCAKEFRPIARTQFIDDRLQRLPEVSGLDIGTWGYILFKEGVEYRLNLQAALLDAIAHGGVPLV